MELIYTNQDYGNQIKQANQAISDLSVYEFEKYFKQLKKIKRVATLKSHRAAIVHALKITHKKKAYRVRKVFRTYRIFGRVHDQQSKLKPGDIFGEK